MLIGIMRALVTQLRLDVSGFSARSMLDGEPRLEPVGHTTEGWSISVAGVAKILCRAGRSI
jgi:hypothetical protein